MGKHKVVDALAVEASDVSGKPGTFDALGRTWLIARKPSPLMLAEMARTEASGGVEALSVVADFFQSMLGLEQYREFRWAFEDAYDESEDFLGEVIAAALEGAFGRPTE
jgi:hypothetical protein